MTLRYDVFLGDVIFIVDGIDFSARWGWVPILDFASGLLEVIKDLSTGKEHSSFDFTESNAEIVFKRDTKSNLIVITSNYNNVQASVKLNDLIRAVVDFSKKLLSDLQELYPET